MKILGITSGGESGAAVFSEGEIIAAVNEERLSRIKLDCSFPYKSISACLELCSLSSQDIDLICFGFTDVAGAIAQHLTKLNSRLSEYTEKERRIILERLLHETRIDARHEREFELCVRELFGDKEIYRTQHHDSHKHAAFVGSGFPSALVVTCDGRGDYQSLTISQMEKETRKNTLLYNSYSWESLGYMYGRMTSLCGFTPNRHEGKITGLAAFGQSETFSSKLKRMIDIVNGRVRSFPGPLYTPFFSNYSQELVNLSEGYSREDLASAAQDHLENILVTLVSQFQKQSKASRLCLAGGVFGNVKLNQKLFEIDGIEELYVFPNMGDGGLCVGGIMSYCFENNQDCSPLGNLFLGTSIESNELRTKLISGGYEVTAPGNIQQEVCRSLGDGMIIGLVQGRMEFGPRSLGHRSILARATDTDINQKLNQRLMRTEFMPFAPCVSRDLASRCFPGIDEETLGNRHMTVTYRVSEEFQKNSPAVTHVDGTARPQVVHRSDDPFLYSLLTGMYQEFGDLSLINTSFNLHEEPIVESADDVMRAFRSGAVDLLVFPPYVCRLPLYL